mmetsp:Transcript_150263/g.280263  ORF Transcript_150263/g.280263 Transcript_150263/m.280263 type:complete len:209 (-) Transcript_150263:1138-1764(-)
MRCCCCCISCSGDDSTAPASRAGASPRLSSPLPRLSSRLSMELRLRPMLLPMFALGIILSINRPLELHERPSVEVGRGSCGGRGEDATGAGSRAGGGEKSVRRRPCWLLSTAADMPPLREASAAGGSIRSGISASVPARMPLPTSCCIGWRACAFCKVDLTLLCTSASDRLGLPGTACERVGVPRMSARCEVRTSSFSSSWTSCIRPS